MNLYMWKRLEAVTSNYHSAAAVVIIAASLDRAHALVPYRGRHEKREPMTEPDVIYVLHEAAEESVFIFPDAGCC